MKQPCSARVSWPDLVLYWARDPELSDLEGLEEHLMGCAECTADSEIVAKLALAARDFVPACVTRAHLGRLQERGARIVENAFVPSARKEVVFPKASDLLIHRLGGMDFANADHVDLTVKIESSGAVLQNEKNVPFDTHEGVFIACQRHFASLPPDVMFELRVTDVSGKVHEATYLIPHLFE